MLIKEYRVILPLSVEEYQVAQLWSVAEASKNETGGGEGIEVLKNEPFEGIPFYGGKYTVGQYTHKIYHLYNKVPTFIRMLAPKGSLEIHEKAWNAYPYCKTVISNPDYMKENFEICIETIHCPDTGMQENAHMLPPEKLRKRQVLVMDIANDPVPSKDYKASEDPKKFKSKKTGRGPLLGPKWWDGISPVMCCYKLVTVHFKWWGLQNRVENFIQGCYPRLFGNFHRQVFCWMDNWYGLTMNDIRILEERVKHELDEQRRLGKIRGMTEE